MAEQMVERVRDAIIDELVPGIRMTPKDLAVYTHAARAAIEAMREPTKAMIEAAYAPTDDLRLARFKWEAMLNAALA